jgi:hypothetical protein
MASGPDGTLNPTSNPNNPSRTRCGNTAGVGSPSAAGNTPGTNTGMTSAAQSPRGAAGTRTSPGCKRISRGFELSSRQAFKSARDGYVIFCSDLRRSFA